MYYHDSNEIMAEALNIKGADEQLNATTKLNKHLKTEA